MSLPVDLPPPRRPLFFPVVIATVFLSIIGMSAGFALGTRHEDARATSSPNATDTPVQDTSIECPPEMHQTALRLGITGRLIQVLRVRADATGTTVWICQDPDGKLYYQANRGGEEAKWVEGETALFLSDVTEDGNTYTAKAADGNTFVVNRSELRVTRNGKETTYEVRPEE
ncbi:hypothetical protein [Actinoplanes sp. NPDC049681]|uniref:hypothetical protein n=1 Tax=Actinoplanes sp. NPDC049681 TaxID=3363905 RepID=UPI0037A7E058